MNFFKIAIVVVIASLACVSAEAQKRGARSSGSDAAIVSALKIADANKNGTLSTSEMSARTKSYLTSLGFDSSRSIRISTIEQKLAQNKQLAANQRATDATKRNERYAANRKVDDFSSTPREVVGVPGFDGDITLTDDELKKRFSANAYSQVSRTLKKHDRDKNGILDSVEQKRASWGSPSAQDSDKNKDGKLSKYELVQRYYDRDLASKAAKDAQKLAQKNSAELVRKSAEARRQAATQKAAAFKANRSRSRSSNTNPFSSSKRGQVSKPSSQTSKQKFNEGNDRYSRYVDGLMRQYDKNQDGKLNSEELGKMRRPPKGADANGDGFVTKAEYLTYYKNKSAGGSQKVTSSSLSKRNKSGRTSSRGSRGSKQTTKRITTSTSFESLDKDGDGQIKMSEFSTEWNDNIVAEFESKDYNSDGLITNVEWAAQPTKPDYNLPENAGLTGPANPTGSARPAQAARPAQPFASGVRPTLPTLPAGTGPANAAQAPNLLRAPISNRPPPITPDAKPIISKPTYPKPIINKNNLNKNNR